MNWEETIQYIRKQPEYKWLVEKAYFEEDLPLNVERYKASEEFAETKKLLKSHAPNARTILDVGSGNGISSIAFALDGYKVSVSEPDPSETVGAGAVRKLKALYKIDRLDVYEAYAEKIDFSDRLFDVVYVRQAMHHAYDLNLFVKNLAGLLKPGGLFITVRDHVIYDEADKQWFLQSHPLQKFYGGENAFTEVQYKKAITDAGLDILKVLKHYDSVINYYPLTELEYNKAFSLRESEIQKMLVSKIGFFGRIPLAFILYKRKLGFNLKSFYDEKQVPGRMYSFIAKKV